MEDSAALARWYIVHTYSGYEKKVMENIKKTIENRHLEDQILEVRVPLEKVMEIKNETVRPVDRKMFPGYVFVHMVYNDDTWYVVRNTRGVTGFVGPGSIPQPLTEEEMERIGLLDEDVVRTTSGLRVDFEVGDRIAVVEGTLAGAAGVVSSINLQKGTVTFSSDDLFGKMSQTTVGIHEVKKV